jgi:hypothetical protein
MTARIPKPGWYEPEQSIVSRYVQAAASGEYPDVLTATRRCMAEIKRLHGRWRRLHPDEARTIRPRTFQTIYTILRKESKARGRPSAGVLYTPSETSLLNRYARAVVEGRYKTAAEATRAAMPELARLWPKAPPVVGAGLPRPFEGVFQRMCILTRRLGQPRPETVWFPAEDRIVARFARRVLGGEFRSARAASPECHSELSSLYGRLRGARGLRLARSAQRTHGAVHIRLILHLQRLGQRGPRRWPWTEPEKRLAAKWAQKHDETVKAGTPWRVSDTIEMLRAELKQRGMRVRDVESCRHALGKLARFHAPRAPRILGRVWHGPADEVTLAALTRFREAESALMERFARIVVRDPDHWVSQAARDLLAGLRQLQEQASRDHPGVAFQLRWRTIMTVRSLLWRRAKTLGMPRLLVRWTPAEDRVLDAHTRSLLEGKYHRITDAAKACLEEIRRSHRIDRAGFPDLRSLRQVCARIDRFALGYGVPYRAADFTAAEMRIIDRHAPMVASGKYKAPLEAARRCYPELKRLWQKAARRIRPPLANLAGRDFEPVHARMGLRAREFGYRGAVRRRWLPAERRIAAQWLRRYKHFLDSDTPWTISDTARSLHESLLRQGFRRTEAACHDELLLELWGRIAPAKFEDQGSGRQKSRGSR